MALFAAAADLSCRVHHARHCAGIHPLYVINISHMCPQVLERGGGAFGGQGGCAELACNFKALFHVCPIYGLTYVPCMSLHLCYTCPQFAGERAEFASNFQAFEMLWEMLLGSMPAVIYIHTYIHMYVCMYVVGSVGCIYIHTYTIYIYSTYLYTYIHTYVYTYIRVYTCTTYIYTYIHT